MFHRNKWAFVNLIPVAGQCSSAARIGPHHWRHRTGAVLSSDKHWHAVLKHCLALLNTARVLWLKHYCQCCHWPQCCPGHCPGSLLSTALWPSHCFRERLLPNVGISGDVPMKQQYYAVQKYIPLSHHAQNIQSVIKARKEWTKLCDLTVIWWEIAL